jgi:hypothetical protein
MYLGNLRMCLSGLDIDKFGGIISPKLNFVPVETLCALSLLERQEFLSRPAEHPAPRRPVPSCGTPSRRPRNSSSATVAYNAVPKRGLLVAAVCSMKVGGGLLQVVRGQTADASFVRQVIETLVLPALQTPPPNPHHTEAEKSNIAERPSSYDRLVAVIATTCSTIPTLSEKL